MRNKTKEAATRICLCAFAAFIPLLLLTYGCQTKKYSDLAREISSLEKKQEDLIEQNKKLVSDISLLASTDRIERIATEELHMHKARTEDIVRVEMNGAKND